MCIRDSSVTGTWIDSAAITTPRYWARNLRETVRFSDCIQELMKEPDRILLEIGPGNTLGTSARQHPGGSDRCTVLSTIRHPLESNSDVAFMLNTLGRLWLAQVEIDWAGFYKNECRHRIPLPTYPFQRKRYWIDPSPEVYANGAAQMLPGQDVTGSMHRNNNGALHAAIEQITNPVSYTHLLSIVVIGRNEGPRLARCLESIRDMCHPDGHVELVYVDSGSNDGSAQRAARFGPKRCV